MAYDELKLENQLCFPLYACSKEIVRLYKPYLDPLNLTYTQYLVMLVLWEKGSLRVKELGELLYLDSGTLTPLLKKIEKLGYIDRQRDSGDERNLIVQLTKSGKNMEKKAVSVPMCVASKMGISENEAKTLYKLLYKVMREKAE
ncbi:MAG: MarR family winged helix-turn-helix transcriptional regulator [Anaerorhabdus sp.]